jgi:hypothetical protein
MSSPKRLQVNPNSSVPRLDQIKAQLQQLARETKKNTADYATMDEFKDMKEIEQTFGALDLG